MDGGEGGGEGKISPMCESIGHRPLRGRCPKRVKKEWKQKEKKRKKEEKKRKKKEKRKEKKRRKKVIGPIQTQAPD